MSSRGTWQTNWGRREVPPFREPKESWLSKLGGLCSSSRQSNSEDQLTPLPLGKSSLNTSTKNTEDDLPARDDTTSVATSLAPSSREINDTTINDSLRNELPELTISDEGYYAYPLSGTHWLDPVHKVLGQPAYLAKKEKPKKGEVMEVKKDYVFGNERYGYGYYHLMTQEAWKVLHKRYKGKNSQVRKILKQRARSKYRNDTRPNQIKFANKVQTLNMRSKEARMAGYALGGSIGAAACAM